MNYSEDLTNLIDGFILEDKMTYAAAHAKAWEIMQTKKKEHWDKVDSDRASRSVMI